MTNSTTAPAGHEQRASWLELFFDLVVVVSVAVLTERIEQHADLPAIALVLTLYLAIWLVWTSFMLYANIAANRTHRRSMLMAMGCLALMAAAIPAVDDDRRGQVFAIVYVVARLVAVRTWRGTTTGVLVDWPIAQRSVGLVPWIVSIWVVDPARYYLWAAGLLLDLVFALISWNDEDVLEKYQRDYDRDREQRARRRGGPRGRTLPPTVELTAVNVNQAHFGERLGIFTIIVLGESVIQIVRAASQAEWDRQFVLAGGSAFLFLFGLWWLTFEYSSYTEGPDRTDALPPHLALPLHFLTTAAIFLMAAGLGEIVLEPGHELHTGIRWLLGAAMAGYLLFSQVALAWSHQSRPWPLVAVGLGLVAVPLLLSGFGAELPGWVFGVVLAAVVGGQVTFRKLEVLHSRGLPRRPARDNG